MQKIVQSPKRNKKKSKTHSQNILEKQQSYSERSQTMEETTEEDFRLQDPAAEKKRLASITKQQAFETLQRRKEHKLRQEFHVAAGWRLPKQAK